MAEFYRDSPIFLPDINGGQRYANGDIVDAEAINKPIEASYYAQELARKSNESVAKLKEKVDELSNKIPNAPSSGGSQWLQFNRTPITGSGNTIVADMRGNPEILAKASWFKFVFWFTDNNHFIEANVPSTLVLPENILSDGTCYRKTLVPFWVIRGMFVYHAPLIVEINPSEKYLGITVNSTDSMIGVNCYVFYQLM
jgi:hypothetical protein